MKYFTKQRHSGRQYHERAFSDNDPLTGLANLFDIGLVFIVGLIMTLFSAYRLQDLFDENTNMTILKQKESGEMEIIRKEGKKIDARKITREKAVGKGIRLGVAYRLEDGTMVYIPESGNTGE